MCDHGVDAASFYGALGGLGGALVLTGFRKVLAAVWVVGTSAPEQVVERLEQLGLVDDWSPEARRVLTGVAEAAAVGSALGTLVWGAGWASWLPITGGTYKKRKDGRWEAQYIITPSRDPGRPWLTRPFRMPLG